MFFSMSNREVEVDKKLQIIAAIALIITLNVMASYYALAYTAPTTYWGF